MPDLDPLPPLPRRPSLPPRPGDFDDMARRVRRRRRGRYAGAGSAVGVAAAVALVMSVSSGGTDTLFADPVSPGDPSPAASVPATATPPAEATPSPVGNPSPTAPPPTPLPPPTASAAPSPTATVAPPGATGEPPSTTAHASLARTVVDYAPGPCSPGGGSAPGWCFRTPGNTTTQAEVAHDYGYEACRLPGSGRGEVAFWTRDEIDFRVDGPTARYQWGHTDFRRVTHRVAVDAGTCLHWVLTWDATDVDGRALPPGRYDGSAGFYASFSGLTAGGTVWGFTVAVTE
ncbi:MAG TPA: hypothetical protein VGX28_09315 [Frankiaceae bacterium]|jgi:hypothetical protein|nr:hypothetical protein [Frankiaceae bacterium]